MSDFVTSIKAILYDRIVSPLFGTFIVSWCAWNYKFVLVVFSSMGIEGKISYIQYVLYADDYQRINVAFWFPVLTTVFALLLYPAVSYPFYLYSQWMLKNMRNTKKKYEDAELLSVEESRAIRRLILAKDVEFDSAITSRDKDILEFRDLNMGLHKENDGLQDKVDALEGEVRDLRGQLAAAISPVGKNHNPQESVLDASQYEALKLFSMTPIAAEPLMLKREGLSQLEAQHDIDVLLKKNFIKYGGTTKYHEKLVQSYEITPGGRDILVRHLRNKNVSTMA